MATNPWSLPTTGNLAFDDYRRALQAWSKAHPYVGDEQYDSRGVQDLVGGGIDSVSNLNPERDEWGQKQNAAFYKQLTPDQLAEWQRLALEHDAKVNRNGKLAAALSFAAVGGLARISWRTTSKGRATCRALPTSAKATHGTMPSAEH